MTRSAIAIGELSRRTGCAVETIRYYERIGLLPHAPRRGRYREYGAEDVRRLAFVRRSRELGFSLASVRALLALAAGGNENCGEARAVAAAHLVEVRAKIAHLHAMEKILGEAVRRCDAGTRAACPVLDTLSSAA